MKNTLSALGAPLLVLGIIFLGIAVAGRNGFFGIGGAFAIGGVTLIPIGLRAKIISAERSLQLSVSGRSNLAASAP